MRGYHVYKDIWTAVFGEEFPCRCATTITTNSFTVPFAHTLSCKTSLVPRTLCMWNFIFKCMLL